MVQSGDWVLVDLRPASRHREAHPQGAANVPLYKEVAGDTHVMGRSLVHVDIFRQNTGTRHKLQVSHPGNRAAGCGQHARAAGLTMSRCCDCRQS